MLHFFLCKLHSISTWFKELQDLSVWMGMIGTSPSWNAWAFFLTLSVVHPWITMLRSPQCLFQLFTYNLTSRLQQLPPSLCCQHVLFYIWPAHLRSAAGSAVCLMCRSVSIFRIERKLSSFIVLHLPLSGFLQDFTHLFNIISCLYLFMCDL